MLFSGLAVSARAQTPDYSQQLRDIGNSLTLLNNTLGNISNPAGPLLSEADYDYRMNQLVSILSYGQSVSQKNNIFSILKEINSNSKLAAELAGNAWWATNSAFSLALGGYSNVFPDDDHFQDTRHSYSFPQLLSIWSARLQSRTADPLTVLNQGWFNQFGEREVRTYANGDAATRVRRGYTWFDWMSDAMRSNLQQVATSQLYPSETEASNSVAALYDSYAEDFNTNAVPETPEFEVEVRQVNGFDAISSPMEDFISDLQPPTTGGISEIVVLPAFDLGGIHTQQYKFDFDTSITPYCRGVMSFIWAVMGGAMIFRLLSGEWAFYTSLGRTTR